MAKAYNILDAVYAATHKSLEVTGHGFKGVIVNPAMAHVLKRQAMAEPIGTVFGMDFYTNRHIPVNRIICFNADGSVAAVLEVDFVDVESTPQFDDPFPPGTRQAGG